MIAVGLFLSSLGLATIIVVVLAELTANRHSRTRNHAHIRARLDPIIDEDEEDRRLVKALVASVIGGIILLAGCLTLTYGMILG